MLIRFVKNAVRSLLQINMPKSSTAKGVKVVSIEEDGQADVYNMEVPGTHCFSVNDGIIVHNCMDATRYFVKKKRLASPKRRT